MRRVSVGVAALVAVLLSGCVPQAPVTPSPSAPTFMCTPEAGGAQAPCSEQQFQEMKAKDALYGEAEQVYRTYQAEYAKVLRAGGSKALTAGLEATIGTKEVATSVLRGLKYFRDNGLRLKGTASVIESVKRRPGIEREASLVAMDFCVNGSATTVYKGKKRQGPGLIGVETVYFAHRKESLRMIAVDSKVVEKCGA